MIDIPLHREPNDGMLTVDILKKCHCMLVIVNISVRPARNIFQVVVLVLPVKQTGISLHVSL